MAERLAASSLPRKGRRQAAREFDDDSDESAGVLAPRILAYGIDSLVLLIFSVGFVGLAFLALLVQSEGGLEDPPDSAVWSFVYISLAVVPAWALFTLFLLARRGQTIGQSVIGVYVARDETRDAGFVRMLVYAMAMHPLVFHPLMSVFWLMLAFVGGLSLTSSNLLFIGSLAVAILCLVAPIAALVTAVSDRGHRGLHDRIAGTTVVRLE